MNTQNKIEADYLIATLAIKDFLTIKDIFKRVSPVDIAEALSEVSVEECIVLYRLLTKRQKLDVFVYLEKYRQLELIEELPDVVVTSLLNEMEPDDRTRLLEDLPEELKQRILLRLSPEERNVAWQLLSYPDDSVGRLMTPDFMVLREKMNASEALDYIRWSSELPNEFLGLLFVCSEDGRLVGEVSLAELVKADPPLVKVAELASNMLVTLSPLTPGEAALELFRKYDRLIIPVVDDGGKIIGIVTADDMFEVAEEEATEDIQQFGGQGALENSYFQTPLHVMIRKRAGWLVLLFFGMLFSGSILRYYEDIITQLSFLVVFLPMVISSGGNSGTQSASLIIRGIAIAEMKQQDWKRVLRREVVTGLTLGLLLGCLGLARSYFWGYSMAISLTVAFTLMGVVIFGAVSGASLPFLFKRMNLDPAVVSSPFIATIVDLSGIFIFISIAKYMTGM